MPETTVALVSAGSAVIGGILGGALSGLYQHLRERWTRPKLQIDYAGNGVRQLLLEGSDSYNSRFLGML
jgi:hypothetical protein